MSFQLSGSGPDIYERTLVPLWFGRWAEALLAQVSLAPGERVLDVACGTGITTRLAKRAVGDDGHVTGLDNNAGMLAMARTLAAELDITWVERDAVDTGLPSDSVDAVISQHGYHYFPDQAAALAEFHRILVPGGRIAVSIWDGHSVYTKALCAALKCISLRGSPESNAPRDKPRRPGRWRTACQQPGSTMFPWCGRNCRSTSRWPRTSFRFIWLPCR